MKKDIIFFKLIAKQKSIIPIVLLTSIGMGFLHRNIENSLLLNIIWAFILSGVILLFNQKGLINWGNKPLFQKLKEGSLIIFGGFLVLLIPITFIVMIGLFFVQIYLVTVLSESGDESTPFIKNKITTIKLSDEERKSFNISQKLNYPEPDSEMELAITQNELKMQEILQAKEDLEKNIADKESEINRIQQEMENNSDYQYAQSLKETIQKSKREKDNLLNKRSQLMMQKQSLEKQLKIQQIKLEHKQREAEELSKERNILKETLKEKEEYIQEEKGKKKSLELEQKNLKEKLNEKYKQIDELKFSKDQEVGNYQQRLQYLERDKKKLENQYRENEEKIINLLEKIKRYENDFAKTQKDLKDKDQRLRELTQENVKLSSECQNMGKELEKKDNDLNEYQMLLADNDKEHALLKEKEKELEEKQQDIEKMLSENEDLKGQLQFFKSEYKELKSTEQQNLVYLTRIGGSKTNKTTSKKQSVKSDIKERFNELYTDLVIEDYFYSQFKDLSKKEQYEVEKQLVYLNYGLKEKLKFRDKSVLMPKGPALDELVYKQKDKSGVGEGRIYVKKKHIFALSTNHNEAKRVIKILKSGSPKHTVK